MNLNNAPDMSVVIVTPDHYHVIRKTIRYLRAQTVKDRLEIIIGAPSRKDLDLADSDLAGFHSYKVVEVGEFRILSHAKALAVRETSAPIVAFAEDHCFPESNWAEALITAHYQGHAAVGPEIAIANPATSVSWAGLFLCFGCCVGPAVAGECTSLPWHNTSYKRHLLIEYGQDLPEMLVVEGILLDDLRAKGHSLYFEPTTKANHVNISMLSSWIRQTFWGGRLFGAMRAQKNKWPLWKRVIYIGGAPLIPVVRMYRALRKIQQVGKGTLLPRIVPAMIAGLLPHAVGEVAGYALGLGSSAERYSFFEVKRFLHVVPGDRQILFE